MTEPPYLASCDADARVADFYNLHLELLPQPYLGRVNTAKVFVLLLNPGYNETETTIELNCRSLQDKLRESLDPAKSRLLHLDDEFDWTIGGKWMRRKILTPLSEQGVAREDLNRNLAIVEYFPYHSKTLSVKPDKLLKSQEYGFELVRQAIKNNALILLMRSEKLWLRAVPELAEYRQSGNCITRRSPRNAILSKGNLGEKNFARVVEALKS